MSFKSSEITIVPESSVQHWNLLFTPPLAAKHDSIYRQTNESIVGIDSEDFL